MVNFCMVKTEDKRRIAVIGVGGWGKNHARVLHEIGVLGSICDKDELRARELARLYDAKPYFSLEQLLENEVPLDGCISLHPYQDALRYGKKNNGKGSSCFCRETISILLV